MGSEAIGAAGLSANIEADLSTFLFISTGFQKAISFLLDKLRVWQYPEKRSQIFFLSNNRMS